MSFEDEIRQTMRVHDAEAPPAHGLVIPSQHGRRVRWLAPIAAAAVVAVVAGGWLAADQLTGSSHHKPSATASENCPASYPTDDEYWVPQQPSVTGANDRLVPNEVPQSMQVCAYLHDDNGQLTGQHAVTGKLAAAFNALPWLPRNVGGSTCADYRAATDSDNYLIRVTYPTGVVWLAAPGNHCDGASNGAFETRANLRRYASLVYRLPILDSAFLLSRNCVGSVGRLGDDKAMVPGTPESVTICAGQPVSQRTTLNIGPLVADLNALPTQPSTGGCRPTRDPNFTMGDYRLNFNYAEGPPAVVDVRVGCVPNVDNFALQAQADQQLVELIQQLAG